MRGYGAASQGGSAREGLDERVSYWWWRSGGTCTGGLSSHFSKCDVQHLSLRDDEGYTEKKHSSTWYRITKVVTNGWLFLGHSSKWMCTLQIPMFKCSSLFLLIFLCSCSSPWFEGEKLQAWKSSLIKDWISLKKKKKKKKVGCSDFVILFFFLSLETHTCFPWPYLHLNFDLLLSIQL